MASHGGKSFLVPMNSQEAVYECINSGLYGQLLKSKDDISTNHMRIVADYASTRPGDHIFLFCERRIYYAGQIQPNGTGGTVLLNGTDTPLDLDVPEYTYVPDRLTDRVDSSGRLTETTQYGRQVRCQPYLFAFTDTIGFGGHSISSNALYNRLARYEFTSSAARMKNVGFCGLSPGETDILLELFEQSSEDTRCTPPETVDVSGFDPVCLTSQYTLESARLEAQIEALLMSEPHRLPAYSRNSDETIARQVPFSSPRRSVDKVDIGAYEPGSVFPNKIYEIKRGKANKTDAYQMKRYYQYASQCEEHEMPEMWILASDYPSTFTGYLTTDEQRDINRHVYSDLNMTLSEFFSTVTYTPV